MPAAYLLPFATYPCTPPPIPHAHTPPPPPFTPQDLCLGRLDLVYAEHDPDDCPVALMEELAAAAAAVGGLAGLRWVRGGVVARDCRASFP